MNKIATQVRTSFEAITGTASLFAIGLVLWASDRTQAGRSRLAGQSTPATEPELALSHGQTSNLE